MWDKSPELFADLVTEVAAKRVKDASTDMLHGLVEKMPVDTSRLVSNVNVSLGAPDDSVNENKYIGRAGARAAGLATINKLNGKNLQSVYFTNTLYYGKYIEGGHSQFAPSGVFLPTFLGVSMWYR